LQRQVDAEVRSAHAAATAAGTLAAQFAETQLPKARELLKIADLSYQEGERSILELLDAYRIVASSELRVLELKSIAKEALIELDLASGAEVLP
jgi:outer membrane protein TolC